MKNILARSKRLEARSLIMVLITSCFLLLASNISAQVRQDRSIIRGNVTSISLKYPGDITTDSLFFQVRTTSSFTSTIHIAKENTVAGGSDAEILATYSYPYTTVKVFFSSANTSGLAIANYYYDLRKSVSPDSAVLVYGTFKIQSYAGEVVNGLAGGGSSESIIKSWIEDSLAVHDLLLADYLLEVDTISLSNRIDAIDMIAADSTDVQGMISDSADVLRTQLLANNDSTAIRTFSDLKYQSKTIVNIKDYAPFGTLADGNVDWTTYIQTAIDDLKGAYGWYGSSLTETHIISFPKGVYLIDEPIQTYSGIVFKGEGTGSILKEANTFTGDALIELTGIDMTGLLVYAGGGLENLQLQAKAGSSLMAIKQIDDTWVLSSNFKNLMIVNFPYGMMLDEYCQFIKISDVTFHGDGMETLLYLTGNMNQVERIDKEGGTGVLSGKPYIIIGDTTAVKFTEKNILRDILLEGTGLPSKKMIYFNNARKSILENYWEEITPASDSGIVFRDCYGINTIGSSIYLNKVGVYNTPNVTIDEFDYGDGANSWEDRLTVDSLSYVDIGTLWGSVSSNAGFLPFNNIKVNKVINTALQQLQDDTTKSQRDFIINNTNVTTSNLVVNGSFENELYKWTFNDANYTATFEPSEVSFGNMLKLDFTGFTGQVKSVYQGFTIPSTLIGVPIVITLKAKLVSDSSSQVGLYSLGAGVRQDGYDGELIENAGWHTLTRTVYPREAGTLYLGFLVYTPDSLDAGNTVVYADDITVSIGLNSMSDNTSKFGSLQFNNAQLLNGIGSPEAVVNAPVGSIYTRTDGNINSSLYIKEVGTDSLGWMPLKSNTYSTYDSLTVLDSSLVIYLPLDETTGSVANDFSIIGTNDGTVNGSAGWNTEGKNVGCLYFDGAGDYINVAHHSSLDLIDNFTISTWVKMSSQETKGIIGKYNNSDAGYSLNNMNSGYTGFPQWASASNPAHSDNFINDSEWHHVIAIQDNGTNIMYVDGVLQAVTGSVAITSTVVDLVIGRLYSLVDGLYFTGYLDDIRIYNRVLTTREILSLYDVQINKTIFTNEQQAIIDNIIELSDTTGITDGYVQKYVGGALVWSPDISTSGSGTFNPDGTTIDTTAGGLARVLPAKVTKWDSVTTKITATQASNLISDSLAQYYLAPVAVGSMPYSSDGTTWSVVTADVSPAQLDETYAALSHTHTDLFDTLSITWGVLDTTYTGSLSGWKVPNDITITEISAYTDANTVTFNLEERAETTPNSAGTDVIGSDLVADTDQQETSTFTNATIAKNTWLVPTISATGDVSIFTISVRYIKTD